MIFSLTEGIMPRHLYSALIVNTSIKLVCYGQNPYNSAEFRLISVLLL